MFIPLILNENIQNSNPHTIVQRRYNPLYDDNITGFTTINGNWIKNKVFIFDFLNTKKSFQTKKYTFLEKYSYPSAYGTGDVVAHYETGQRWVTNEDEWMYISSGPNLSGGTDSAFFEMNINIPWTDIRSWLNINGVDHKNGKIKNLYLYLKLS